MSLGNPMLHFRLAPADLDRLKLEAHRAGITLSALIRCFVLEGLRALDATAEEPPPVLPPPAIPPAAPESAPEVQP